MTHIHYVTYDEVSLKCNAHGIFEFDTREILRLMARKYFVMPQWVDSIVEEVFNSSALIKADTKEEIRKVINQKVVEINNKIVPIARLHKMKNSECPDWIKLPNYATEDDIVAIVNHTYTRGSMTPTGISLNVNYHYVLEKVTGIDSVLDESQVQELQRRLEEFVENDKSLNSVGPYDTKIINDKVAVITQSLVRVVNEYVSEIATPILIAVMKDTYGLNPYFSYNGETKEVEYTLDRVLHLLDAMGYAALDDGDTFEEYLDTLKAEVEEEMLTALIKLNYTEADINDEFFINNLTMSVNLSILNRLLFIKNNSIAPKNAKGLIYPEPAASQLDIELYYVDACVEMMTYDAVLEDISHDTSKPKSDLREDVLGIINETKNTFTILRGKDESLDAIYRGVRHTYFDAYNRVYDRLTSRPKGWLGLKDLSSLGLPKNTIYNAMGNWTTQ